MGTEQGLLSVFACAFLVFSTSVRRLLTLRAGSKRKTVLVGQRELKCAAAAAASVYCTPIHHQSHRPRPLDKDSDGKYVRYGRRMDRHSRVNGRERHRIRCGRHGERASGRTSDRDKST